MNPEKEIVNVWLNKQGFFTINNINAGRNRIIDIIAIKQTRRKIDEVWHVEVHASLVSPQLSERERSDLAQKFENPQIISAVKKTIREFIGEEAEPRKVLISTVESIPIPNVEVIRFDDVIVDVLSTLDRQNYRDDALRTLQLMKYLVLRKPAVLKSVIGKLKGESEVRRGYRREVITELLSSEQAKSELRNKSSESLLVEILEGSSLASSEKFAKLLATKILSKRARTAFLKELIPQAVEEEKKEQSLDRFI
ncbi:MAG: hypothetical protein EPN86_06070 [Nanoarchaeota archaeon]|nr:MAG: hypothetical protein EPN86_06070 [Nanoarchaeota archaeon]